MADRQDVGVKVSQTGYSAVSAPDYALTFSSSWPQLPIVMEFLSTLAPVFNAGPGDWTYPTITFTHNLGYPAFAMCWTKGGGYASSSSVRRIPYGVKIGKNTIVCTVDTVHYASAPPTLTVFARVYALDISVPVSYPYKQPPVFNNPYDPDYGVKIVKEGKNIDSKDMRDFILHSRCQSPQIDSVNVGAANTTVTYTNSTGYTNWVFGFGSFDGGNTYIPANTDSHQSPPGLFITGNVYSSGATSPSLMPVIVVLRDPLFVAKQVEIIY